MSFKMAVRAGVLAMLLLILIMPALAGDGASAEIKFTGTVRAVGPPVMGARWWNVTVENVISGPAPCSGELYVHLYIVPPMGYFDYTVAIGDNVEVYGRYESQGAECRVSLNGENYYYLKKIPPPVPALTPPGLAGLAGMLATLAALALRRRH
jgi:hypothetical protein